MTFHDLQISLINRETPNSVRIGFDVPADKTEAFSFVAGQYLTLKTQVNGQELRRDYSICTTPQSGKLEVVVKAVEGGQFSTFANETLAVGDRVEVAEPQGRFTFSPDQGAARTVVAFAAGSGITPIMGIMRTLLENELQSKFILVYGNQNPQETIFLDSIRHLIMQYPNRLKVQWIFSKSNESDALFGRIDKAISNFLLKKFEELKDADSYYLCGPGGMIETVSQVLQSNDIDEDKIKFELFTAAPAAGSDQPSEVSEGTCHVEVLVDDEEADFDMPKDKTILEMALKAGIDAPYSCQGGICSSCIARLTEGEVKMRQNNILTDSEVKDGLILTCQAEPISSKVKIDYDDV